MNQPVIPIKLFFRLFDTTNQILNILAETYDRVRQTKMISFVQFNNSKHII